jgi:hypothetical protein
LRQYYVPMPHGRVLPMPEQEARAYIASIMDQSDHYWLVRRMDFEAEELEWHVTEGRFKTLREAIAFGIWRPEILERAGVDTFHAICFLVELGHLECSDEFIWDGVVELPPLWERLGQRPLAVQ